MWEANFGREPLFKVSAGLRSRALFFRELIVARMRLAKIFDLEIVAQLFQFIVRVRHVPEGAVRSRAAMQLDQGMGEARLCARLLTNQRQQRAE